MKIGQTLRRYRDFVIFQDGGRCHLGFSKILNFNGWFAAGVQYASLYQILSKSVKRLQIYSDLTVFSKWRPSAIFDLLGAYWDHPRRPLDSLQCCAKFGWNRCSSFDNMKLSIFAHLAWKCLFTPQKLGFSEDFTPKMSSNLKETPKRHIFVRVHAVWAIKCENRPV